MIKKILSLLLFISTSLMANDFKLIIHDELTGDIQIENHLSVFELKKALGEIKKLNDSFLKTEIYENKKNNNTISAVNGGAEGG